MGRELFHSSAQCLTFEVYVRGVDERREFLDHLRLCAAVRDEDVEHTPPAHFSGAVAHELPADERLVVCVGETDVAVFAFRLERQVGQLVRHCALE